MTTPDVNRVTHRRSQDIPAEPLKGTVARRLVTGERAMRAHVDLRTGADVPRRAHDEEQLTYVLDGALQFRAGTDDERTVAVRAGEMPAIPPAVARRALVDMPNLDVFTPPRADWLNGTDAYLRR